MSRTRPACHFALPLATVLVIAVATVPTAAARTAKPVLHAQHWLAITGKPLAATAGSMMFQKGGNAVDAAAAMLAATCTMWDTLGWGGETQALIWNPETREVVAINALGVAPTGATAEFFRRRDLRYPPEYGPLAAVTPGTPGGLMTMLAEYGRLSLAEVLEPAIQMADGFPIEEQLVRRIESQREVLEPWAASRAVFLPNGDEDDPQPPEPGQIFRQPDLAATLRKLVAAERQALDAGKSREQAIQAAYDRFYRGDIAAELVRAMREDGGLFTLEDLDHWQVKLEEPVHTSYDGIDVYKLTTWTQGPVMLQALNLLEPMDLEGMGLNSARYIHTLYQVMNLAYADRDFYYGDPAFPPEEPIEGLLSKQYANARRQQIDWERNDAEAGPGDPYPFQGGENPFSELLEAWPPEPPNPEDGEADQAARGPRPARRPAASGAAPSRTEAAGLRAGRVAEDEIRPLRRSSLSHDEAFRVGTTSIVAADEDGWVVSITPSGGWVPAYIAGSTGIGLSQRMQQFVLDPAENPYNVVEPGKRPRVTLTPSLAVKDGKPWLAFAVQGGDTQDQNLLQFFLNIAEFGMNVQEAAEGPNITSYQMHGSFGNHESRPGRIIVHSDTSPWVRDRLADMGYEIDTRDRTSGPITAILIDHEHGTFWGGASDYGEDYGIGW